MTNTFLAPIARSIAPPTAGIASGAYAFHRYPDADAARQAITHDQVPAALVAEGHELRLLVAGAQGPSLISSVAAGANEAVGHPVPMTDVRPLAAEDARGLSAFYAAFGVVLAGFLFAVSSYQIAPRLSLVARLGSMLAFSAASGVVVALIAHTAMNALPAPFFTVAVVVGMPAWATAAATGVMLRLFGRLGMPVASVVLLIFGNATSGGILPATFLPVWLSPLSQILAPAAAIHALRGAAYFHNANLTGGLLNLAVWAVGCVALLYTLDLVAARRSAAKVPASDGMAGR